MAFGCRRFTVVSHIYFLTPGFVIYWWTLHSKDHCSSHYCKYDIGNNCKAGIGWLAAPSHRHILWDTGQVLLDSGVFVHRVAILVWRCADVVTRCQ